MRRLRVPDGALRVVVTAGMLLSPLAVVPPRALAQQAQGVELVGQALDDLNARCGSIALQGRYAYVGAADYGLRIVDVSDPSHPFAAGVYPDARAYGVAVAGHYAFVIDWYEGLDIVDVSDPAHPQLYLSCCPMFEITHVRAFGNLVYSAYAVPGGSEEWGDFGLTIYDAAASEGPRFLAQMKLTERVNALAADGHHVYLAMDSGLCIVSVLAPTQPQVVASLPLPEQATGVAVCGSRAYVSTASGLRVIDVQPGAAPSQIGLYPAGGSIAATGNYVYLGSSGQLQVLDASDPVSPALAGYYDYANERWRASDIAAAGNYAYVATWYGGLTILRFTDGDVCPGPPYLEGLPGDGEAGSYGLRWDPPCGSAASTTYVVQEDDSGSFPHAFEVHRGAATTVLFSGKGPGLYYYRVRAVQSSCASAWSNVGSVTILATPTATPLPETIVTLQNGLDGYLGAEDTHIYRNSPTINYCARDLLQVGYKQQYAALLRFDLSSIPPNAVVSGAALELYARGWNGGNLKIDAFRLLRDSNLCQANWNQARSGENWGTAGANDARTDRAGTPESTVTANGVSRWYAFDLTVLVQDWVKAALPNRGVLLRGAPSSLSPTFYFPSAQSVPAGLRPKLVITYKIGSGPAPTQTPAITPTATPTSSAAPVRVDLQNGSAGYSGCEDTYIHTYSPASNYCRHIALRAGYKQQYAGLLRFDLSSIPVGSTVVQADLRLYATGWSGTNVALAVYRLLRGVNSCEATWNLARSGEPWGLPGGNDTARDRAAVAESSLTTAGISKWYRFDMTGLVEDWLRGSLANNGMLLRGVSGTAAADFQFASNEHGTPSLHPILSVTYRPPS